MFNQKIQEGANAVLVFEVSMRGWSINERIKELYSLRELMSSPHSIRLGIEMMRGIKKDLGIKFETGDLDSILHFWDELEKQIIKLGMGKTSMYLLDKDSIVKEALYDKDGKMVIGTMDSARTMKRLFFVLVGDCPNSILASLHYYFNNRERVEHVVNLSRSYCALISQDYGNNNRAVDTFGTPYVVKELFDVKFKISLR